MSPKVFVKGIVKRFLRPWFKWRHDRKIGADLEGGFWDRWMATRGGEWASDFTYRVNPDAEITGLHRELVEKLNKSHIDILDVGAGPLTAIGKKHPHISLNITAVDPLAETYDRLLNTHRIEAPVRTQLAAGEKLEEVLRGRTFDWVHAQNCIDHAENPELCVRSMISSCKPGGIISLWHEENEADKENWRGFHRWNFSYSGTNNGDMHITGIDGSVQSVRSIAGKDASIELCELRKDHVLVVLRKN